MAAGGGGGALTGISAADAGAKGTAASTTSAIVDIRIAAPTTKIKDDSVLRCGRSHVEMIVQANAGDGASVFEMGCKNRIRRCAGCARDDGAICGEGGIAEIVIKGFAFNRQLAECHLASAACRPSTH